ncbi:MAG: cupin domain-containing protein [Actinomycetota bacterium]
MVDVGGGVYVSRTDTQEWEPDDEVGGSAHMLFDLGATKAGLWRAEGDERGDPVDVEIPARETIVVLEGAVRVGVDGEPHDLREGDMLSIPAGTMVGWDPSPGCKVFWVYS